VDINAYINSGILELYVLDRLAPDERRQVELYAEQYPEVRQEISDIELALEEYALLQGSQTPPAPRVLEAVLATLPTQTTATKPTTTPKTTAPPPTSGTPNIALWVLALLLALALAGLVYFMLQSQQKDADVSELQDRFSILEQECDLIRQRSQQNEQQVAILSDVNTQDILLAGSENAPDSRAVVFYNPSTAEVLFSAANLPAPPAGKQYQLWAINDDGPQDLGVLDRNLDSNRLLDVPFVPNTNAFAITLEDEGGKAAPDLTQLQVIGEVGS
jgi:anti-sigma-K factor RskA